MTAAKATRVQTFFQSLRWCSSLFVFTVESALGFVREASASEAARRPASSWALSVSRLPLGCKHSPRAATAVQHLWITSLLSDLAALIALRVQCNSSSGDWAGLVAQAARVR